MAVSGLAKYIPILEYRVSNPTLTVAEVAEHFGYSEGQMGRIMNSEVFVLAQYGLQQKALAKMEERVAKLKIKAEVATGVAIDFNQKIIEEAAHPVEVKQESSKQILALGHAKAVEKTESKNLTAVAQLPQEVVLQLLQAADRLSLPFIPSRPLLVAEEADDE